MFDPIEYRKMASYKLTRSVLHTEIRSNEFKNEKVEKLVRICRPNSKPLECGSGEH